MTKKLLMLMLWLLSAGILHAASFDCNKASQPVEQVICSNEDVSVLDSQLGHVFNSLVAKLDGREREVLKGEQRLWLKNERTSVLDKNQVHWKEGAERPATLRSIDKTSLIYRYKTRISDLELKQKMVDDGYTMHSGRYLRLTSVLAPSSNYEEVPALDFLDVDLVNDGKLAFLIRTVGGNGRTCVLDGIANRKTDNSFHFTATEAGVQCNLLITKIDRKIMVSADGCYYFCGDGAGLDSEFPLIGITSVVSDMN